MVFGNYWTDADRREKKEPIEGLLLKWEVDKIFLFSKNNVDCRLYHEDSYNVNWKKSAIRHWLNTKFLLTPREKRGPETTKWWLRIPGQSDHATYAYSLGDINAHGTYADGVRFGIRPAMRLARNTSAPKKL